MENLKIRDVRESDIDRILEIYTYYIENTAISFECEVPSLSEFQARVKSITGRYPYLVVEKDGVVAGYAYGNSFIGRSAYDWSAELSIYLDRSAQKLGLGRKLYEALENRLREMGILNLYACIAYPQTEDEFLNKNSAEFHSHLGFKEVGKFHDCGHKFGRWYDMIWMEKIIGSHQPNQPPVKFLKG